MSDNNEYLSQEEIDALLNQTSESDDDGGGASSDESGNNAGEPLQVDDYLTALEQDALGEIGNITFGSSATALSTLLGKKVDITTPKVAVISKKELDQHFPQPHVAVHVKYVEGFQGINLLVIKTEDAQVIADLMLGGDGTNITGELTEIHISAVQEAMNQMMGSAATSMSTLFNRMVNISPPGIDILNVAEDEGVSNLPKDEVLVTISFRLKIEELIDSYIMQMLTVPFSKEMVSGLLGEEGSETPVEETTPESIPENTDQPFSTEELNELTDQLSKQSMNENSGPAPHNPPQPPQQPQQQPMQQAPYQGQGGNSGMQQNRDVNVQPVQYANFAQEPSTVGDMNLNLLLDIPLKVTVELGRTKKLIRDILEFTQGSIIELDKLAGEPVDILVNDKLIAKGEVVVIDENFGVRVTDIVSQQERMNKIQY